MIPVSPKEEPEGFDEWVRKPGLAWLSENNIDPKDPPPVPGALPPHWRRTQKPLWDAYEGVCAYLCIYFEWVSGSSSTDHFVPKSRIAGRAYEWSNYRLSCLGMNRNKNKFDDVLDPFVILPDTFVLNLVSGKIRPNDRLSPDIATRAQETIKRLNLDRPEVNEMRAQHFFEYLRQEISESYLARHSPFVWYEAGRQGLL